jgi:predicted amidophosphoribosyltransferase
MFCIDCGTELHQNGKFCAVCGAPATHPDDESVAIESAVQKRKRRAASIADSLYRNLSPGDRERALSNLNRYFEIVLGISLRLAQEEEERRRAKYPEAS